MSLDPENVADRGRLQSAMDWWYREHEQYRLSRRELIQHHVGSQRFAGNSIGFSPDKPMFGNLIQMSANAHAVTMAYGIPQYKVVAEVPEAEPIIDNSRAFLNRYAKLLHMQDLARQWAMDSFFGYAIAKVGYGILPASIQQLTKQQAGPLIERVSQDNFLFDGNARSWEYVTWFADTMTVPLSEAQQFADFQAYNPEGTEGLSEFQGWHVQTDSRIHNDNAVTQRTAIPMVRLVNVYLPYSGLQCVWPANDDTFTSVTERPLLVRKWNGHHSGMYQVMTDLDIPDNLIPVTAAESTLRLHTLFNELGDKTANQATSAKAHPIYETGSHRDMERLETTKDRKPVAVSNINKIGMWQKPGPDQSQTSYMQGTYAMFKEFAGNLDDVLGLSPTAGTATQSQLIRQATNIRVAEKRRRQTQFHEGIGQKLLHLALNDESFALPIVEPIGKTGLSIDRSWQPPSMLPRHRNADDFQITLIPYTLERRDPAVRLAQLNEATQQIVQAIQVAAQFGGLDVEEFIELQAEYRDLPELRNIWAQLLPAHLERREAGQIRAGRTPGTGEYTRQNVSQRSNGGALTQAFTQFGSESSLPTAGTQVPQQ